MASNKVKMEEAARDAQAISPYHVGSYWIRSFSFEHKFRPFKAQVTSKCCTFKAELKATGGASSSSSAQKDYKRFYRQHFYEDPIWPSCEKRQRRLHLLSPTYLQPGCNENRAVIGLGESENGASQHHKAWSYM